MSFYEQYAELMKANKLTINRPIEWFEKYKDSKCKKCYGRGYTAEEVEKNLFVPCKCAIKNFLKTIKDKER